MNISIRSYFNLYMKPNNHIIMSLLMVLAFALPGHAQTAQSIHRQIHNNLLANVKSGLDKNVIQEYIRKELEGSAPESPYPGLSAESAAMISDLLTEAGSHKGKKYRRGSKGPSSFDCSGFTGYVYSQFGFKLGASSSGQFSDGVPVEKGDLRPGDLVFFTGRNSKGGVGHVGIVVKADNDSDSFSFIHATISGGIRVDKSSAPYYSKRYLGARRIITE